MRSDQLDKVGNGCFKRAMQSSAYRKGLVQVLVSPIRAYIGRILGVVATCIMP